MFVVCRLSRYMRFFYLLIFTFKIWCLRRKLFFSIAKSCSWSLVEPSQYDFTSFCTTIFLMLIFNLSHHIISFSTCWTEYFRLCNVDWCALATLQTLFQVLRRLLRKLLFCESWEFFLLFILQAVVEGGAIFSYLDLGS